MFSKIPNKVSLGSGIVWDRIANCFLQMSNTKVLNINMEKKGNFVEINLTYLIIHIELICIYIIFYLFINYSCNTITNYIWIIYELNNWVPRTVSRSNVTVGNRTHDPHANNVTHCPLDYQGTHSFWKCFDC